MKTNMNVQAVKPMSRREWAYYIGKLSADIDRMDPEHDDTYTQMCALCAERHYFEEARPR